jgi:hypothetical protein
VLSFKRILVIAIGIVMIGFGVFELAFGIWFLVMSYNSCVARQILPTMECTSWQYLLAESGGIIAIGTILVLFGTKKLSLPGLRRVTSAR